MSGSKPTASGQTQGSAPDYAESTPPQSAPDLFGRFRGGIDRTAQEVPPAVPRGWLITALVSAVLVIASGFAPWIVSDRADGETRVTRGTGTDGVFLVISGIVVLLALGFVLGRKDKAAPATIGFGAACVCFVTAITNWIFIDSMGVDPSLSSISPSTGWGVMLATVASLLAVIATFRVMRVARIY